MADPRRTSFFRPVQQGFLAFILALGFVAACFAVYDTRWTVLTLVIGLGLGVILNPLVNWLHRRARLPLALSLVIVLLGLTTIILGGVYLIGTLVAAQADTLTRQGPELIRKAQAAVDAFLQRYPWFHMKPGGFRLSGNVVGAAATAIAALETSVTVLAGLVFVIVIALYYAADPDLYVRGFLSGVPAHARGDAATILKESGAAVRRWFYSQLIAMVIMGVIVSVGLRILGSQYWLLLGFVTAGLELIPYFGPIAALVVGGLVTLGSQPQSFWWVMLFYFGALRLEGDLIIPLLMKGRNRLPPIHLLVLMLVLGEWFGVLGFVITTPVLAVLRTIYLMAWVPRMNRKTRPSYVEPAMVPTAMPSPRAGPERGTGT